MTRTREIVAFIGLVLICSTADAATVADYTSLAEYGYGYLDPRPESEYVAPETGLLIRFDTAVPDNLLNLSDFILVEGQYSGPHTGETAIAGDGRTITFTPSAPFTPNEAVNIALTPWFDAAATGSVEPIQYRFYVLRSAAAPSQAASAALRETTSIQSEPWNRTVSSVVSAAGEALMMSNGVSVPGDFPHVYVSRNRDPADGYLFLEYSQEPQYALILNNDGAPVWYRRGKAAIDFGVQNNGMITEAPYRGYDQDFNWVKDFHTTNGYETDSHELHILKDGGYLLIGVRTFDHVDMSRMVDGGHPDATIHETCIQEFTADDELIFQWRAWENFDIATLGPEDVEDVRAATVRVSHINAIDIDEDGQILVTSRHFSEVTKIDRRTGQVIWRLGGPHSDFSFVDDPLEGFSCPHDIRALGNHRYTLFDNGNAHDPPVSRAVEYELNTNHMTATLVWEYRATPDRFAYHQGSVQRLPNGNTLINFAMPDYPKVTEVNGNGEIELEMGFISGNVTTYRVRRFPWIGSVRAPYLIVEPNSDKVTLLFNKFGDPNVACYQVYGGLDPHPETVMAVCETTMLDLHELENDRQYYFRVTAVDTDGTESDFSNEESTLVYLYDPNEPSENMVRNGDFSQGETGWTLSHTESTDVQWSVEDGQAHIAITDGGSERSNIRLVQTGLKLVRGETYVLEFDAGAAAPRLIEVKVNKKNVGAYWDYSKMGPVYLTTARQSLVMKHFTQTFTVERETDLDACLEIHLGSDDVAVYLDNVSLVRQAR